MLLGALAQVGQAAGAGGGAEPTPLSATSTVITSSMSVTDTSTAVAWAWRAALDSPSRVTARMSRPVWANLQIQCATEVGACSEAEWLT